MDLPVFLFGTLRDADLLSLVAGLPVATEAARLPGEAALRASDGAWPLLVTAPGAAEGLLLRDPAPGVIARLDHYEDAFGYVPVPCKVETSAGPEEAVVYRPAGDPGPASGVAWSLAVWQTEAKDEAMEAAPEILSYLGRYSGSELQFRAPQIVARAASRLRARAAREDRHVGIATRRDTVDHRGVEAKHTGFFRTEEHRLRHPTFAGGLSPEITREIFVAADAAIVLPYDPVRDTVLLVEQFRMGPFGRGATHPWMLEPVAGRIDGGEPPETAARRECEEEAGLSLQRLEPIAECYPSPGFLTEYFYIYLGLCDIPPDHVGTGGLDSEDEDIRTHILPFEEAMDLMSRGEADNAPLILALLWLQRERPRLRSA